MFCRPLHRHPPSSPSPSMPCRSSLDFSAAPSTPPLASLPLLQHTCFTVCIVLGLLHLCKVIEQQRGWKPPVESRFHTAGHDPSRIHSAAHAPAERSEGETIRIDLSEGASVQTDAAERPVPECLEEAPSQIPSASSTGPQLEGPVAVQQHPEGPRERSRSRDPDPESNTVAVIFGSRDRWQFFGALRMNAA